MLSAGCDAAAYTFPGTGNKTIEVNNAEDGAFGESGRFSVGRGRTAVAELSLDKGDYILQVTAVMLIFVVVGLTGRVYEELFYRINDGYFSLRGHGIGPRNAAQ